MRRMNPAQRALFEKRGRRLVGRDPRQVSREEFIAAGHGLLSPLDALRSRCLDCTADSVDEVRTCTTVLCFSWPFRMGTIPLDEPAADAQREAQRQSGARLAMRQSASSLRLGETRELDVAATTLPPAELSTGADGLSRHGAAV